MMALFLVLQPKVSAALFPRQRQAVFTDFLATVRREQRIPPREFWQFREFFSPGDFTVDPEAVGIFQTFRIETIHAPHTNLLHFSAPYLQSQDSLISSPQWYQDRVAGVENPLFQNERSVIFSPTAGVVRIVFYAPIAEMQQANGFFDYLPEELERIENFWWLNETELVLP